MYQGIVTNIKDPEQRGRIKVKCPSVLGGTTESAWCDPVVPVAYDYGGDFCIPLVDEAVWIQFIEGDANRPVWLGGWWQSNMSPLSGNYGSVDKLRIINYADCTIMMQNGIIDINIGEGNSQIRVENETVTITGNLLVKGSVTVGDLIAISGENGGGTITADSTIKSGNISLTTHKHSDVTTGSDKTGKPTT